MVAQVDGVDVNPSWRRELERSAKELARPAHVLEHREREDEIRSARLVRKLFAGHRGEDPELLSIERAHAAVVSRPTHGVQPPCGHFGPRSEQKQRQRAA
jgi:hypothetical protein